MIAVCLASGPSLTIEDVEKVREWRRGGGLVIVANTTFRLAPWADALFAMDGKWWRVHYDEVLTTFAGRRLTTATVDDVEKIRVVDYRNSGAACVSVAASEGAKKVILLGYDCAADAGRTHWHGSHPAGLSDAKTIKVWPLIFDRLAKDMKRRDVEVVNASRRTALRCFPRVRLEDELNAAARTN